MNEELDIFKPVILDTTGIGKDEQDVAGDAGSSEPIFGG